MAETTADVRRDIELTRERMSDTIAQIEQKMNVMGVVREHPWPALALAAGAGFLLANSRADVKAAAATVTATGGASSKLGGVLDDLAASLIGGVTQALNQRVDGWVGELKTAIGAPGQGRSAAPSSGAAVSRTAGANSDVVDRQRLGFDESSPRSSSASAVGLEQRTEESGVLGSPSLAH